MAHEIESPANDRIKGLVRLRRRTHRDQASVFLVEERRILDRALESGYRPVEVFWSPEISERPWDGDVVTVAAEAMEKASYGSRSEGLIAVFRHFDLDLDRLSLGSPPLVLVAENMEKPGNIGAMLRVADAAGFDALVVADPLADPFNPNAVRASTGAIFTVPVAMAPTLEVIDWLETHSIRSLAAADRADVTLWETDFTGPSAIWVGSEADGLGAQALGEAHYTVRIPMQGKVDSLNASVSAAVLAYEARRQRTQSAGA